MSRPTPTGDTARTIPDVRAGAAARVRRRLSRGSASLAALVIAVLWTLPTAGLFVSSFRPAEDIRTTGWWTFFADPKITLDNYRDVLFGSASDGRLASYFVNSIAITLPATIFVLGVAALAAYALAWIDFRGRDWLFLGIFALQIVPLQMSLVPLLRFFSQGVTVAGLQVLPAWELGGAMAFTNVWVAHTIFGLPLGIFLLHNFISQLPKSLFEAARVDGAGHGRIFTRIVLPLIAPALVSLGIFQFLWVWNDMLVALVLTSPDSAPLTVALRSHLRQFGTNVDVLASGAFLSMLVPLLVFFAFQRYFVQGAFAATK